MRKSLFITGSNNDPRIGDDWMSVIDISADSTSSIDQLIEMCDAVHHTEGMAIWLYEGEDWEDKVTIESRFVDGTVRFAKKFYPWDTDDVTLIRAEHDIADDDDVHDDVWKQDIAMEAGMLGGCEAYNETMGY